MIAFLHSLRRLWDRAIFWAYSQSEPIPNDHDGHTRYSYNCKCPECGLVQLVSVERDCARCGAWVSSWDHELPKPNPELLAAEAAEFYAKRMSRWAAAKEAVKR